MVRSPDMETPPAQSSRRASPPRHASGTGPRPAHRPRDRLRRRVDPGGGLDPLHRDLAAVGGVAVDPHRRWAAGPGHGVHLPVGPGHRRDLVPDAHRHPASRRRPQRLPDDGLDRARVSGGSAGGPEARHDRHSTAAGDGSTRTGPRVGRTGRGLSGVGRHDRNHPGVRVGTARADAGHPGPDLHPLRALVPDLSAPESAAHPAELDRPAARRRDRARVHRILRGIPRADDDGRDGAHRRVRPAKGHPLGRARRAGDRDAVHRRDLDGHTVGVSPRLRGPGLRPIARGPAGPDLGPLREVAGPLSRRDALRLRCLRGPALGRLLPGAGARPGSRGDAA